MCVVLGCYPPELAQPSVSHTGMRPCYSNQQQIALQPRASPSSAFILPRRYSVARCDFPCGCDSCNSAHSGGVKLPGSIIRATQSDSTQITSHPESFKTVLFQTGSISHSWPGVSAFKMLTLKMLTLHVQAHSSAWSVGAISKPLQPTVPAKALCVQI